jgi:predicted site-specific integrase-resolvase
MLLTEAEVAERLRVSRATLRDWRHRKIGPPFLKLGRAKQAAIRYRDADLAPWLARHVVETTFGR